MMPSLESSMAWSSRLVNYETKAPESKMIVHLRLKGSRLTKKGPKLPNFISADPKKGDCDDYAQDCARHRCRLHHRHQTRRAYSTVRAGTGRTRAARRHSAKRY